ncbi:MAG: DUF2127 domain-containing protein [Halothiobacillaceae bacterium]|nr:DUF2127 domain-containing protein [Halothiobacillaceae bacterium]
MIRSGKGGERGDVALRAIALTEMAKGVVVLLAGFGLLALIHSHAQLHAETLVRHFHLNPAHETPRIFLHLMEGATDPRHAWLAFAALAYALLRLAEGFGLWFDRRWAEWLGALSGGIYLPIELYELFQGVSALKLSILAVNLIVVSYLGRRLWLKRKEWGDEPG